MADSESPPRNPALRDLTSGPIATTLLVFALPTLGANILQSLNGTINAVWIGQFLGEAALAATANANNIMFLMFAAVFGLSVATSILVGQAIGARDVDAARRALGASVGVVTAIGVATAILGWIYTPDLLHLLATPRESFALATDYLRFVFVALPPTFIVVLVGSAMRGAGDAITPLRATILGVVIDAGLNPFLILGIGPFPELGIAGSAIAMLISALISVGYLVAVLYARDLPLRLRGHELAYLIPTRALTGAILGKGLPMGLSLVVLSGAMIAQMGLVNRAGVDTAAAFGAISQLWNYVQMPALAIGAGVSAMAAQNIGAGRWDRVEQIAWSGSWINIAITGATVVMITLADRPLLSMFLTSDSAALPIAVHINHVVSWSFMMFGVSLVLISITRANGSVVAPLIMLFIAFFPVRFGAALAFEPVYGAEAIWWSFPLGSAVSLAMTLAYYRWGNWRQARMLAPGAMSG